MKITKPTLTGITRDYLKNFKYYFRCKKREIFKPDHVWLHGVRIDLHKDFSEDIVASLYWEQYEQGEAACIKKARLSADDTVLEIGSGLGYLSTLCAKVIGGERIFAYEANPAMIPVIQHTYHTNGVSPHLMNAAVGLSAGYTEFFGMEDFTGSSLLQRDGSSQKFSVQSVSINEEITRIKPTILIIDVEGAEYDLLLHTALGTIEKIIIELHKRIIGEEKTNSVRNYLSLNGFSVNTDASRGETLFLERLA